MGRNNLLQIGVEPWATIPIYIHMYAIAETAITDVQNQIILKFLADSRSYLTL